MRAVVTLCVSLMMATLMTWRLGGQYDERMVVTGDRLRRGGVIQPPACLWRKNLTRLPASSGGVTYSK